MPVRSARDPRLRGIIATLWCSDGRGAGHLERVIPTGQAHLVWRLGAPIGIVGGPTLRAGALGGPRATAHVHHTSDARSIGVLLRPGALARLSRVPAVELTGRHVDLRELWPDAAYLQDALESGADLDHLEAWLAARLLPLSLPPLGPALDVLDRGGSVGDAATAVGRSSRTLRLWFDQAVGLPPATWRVVRRVRRALTLAHDDDGAGLARAVGFADQAHLCNDFRAVTGLTLTEWRARRLAHPSHVREPADSSKPSEHGGRYGTPTGGSHADS